IETFFDPQGYQLPDEIKTIIYRVAQEALDSLSRQDAKLHIRLGLRQQGDEVTLSIEEFAVDVSDSDQDVMLKEAAQQALSIMKQRTMLSGGTFELKASDDGKGILACASWLLDQ
ncbi:MAG: hypothetical protein P8047_17255, partial [Gammaproteobacteria bacterium]